MLEFFVGYNAHLLFARFCAGHAIDFDRSSADAFMKLLRCIFIYKDVPERPEKRPQSLLFRLFHVFQIKKVLEFFLLFPIGAVGALLSLLFNVYVVYELDVYFR